MRNSALVFQGVPHPVAGRLNMARQYLRPLDCCANNPGVQPVEGAAEARHTSGHDPRYSMNRMRDHLAGVPPDDFN
jgi:hypothetical protein